MSSTPGSQGQEMPARRLKGPFFPADDTESDTVQPSVFNTGRRANYNHVQEPDVFGESVEDTIDNMRNNNNKAGNTGPAAPRSQSSYSTELFVTDTEGGQHGGDIPKNPIEVKSEPESDEDNDFMIIDQADASADARLKWSLPQHPTIIDLETLVKKEPLADVNPILPAMSILPAIVVLESRKQELQSKALQGALSSDELEEMMHIMSQLTQAQNAARTGSNPNSPPIVALPKPDHHKQATGQGDPEKPKAKRKAPIGDAVGYWARREQKEREQEAKGRGRRGGVHGNTSRKTKRARISDNRGIGTDDEELERLIDTMLKPHDAIQHRADQGDLPAAPTITATRRDDQLKQMREAAPQYFDPKILNKQKKELRKATKAWGPYAVHCKDGKWELRDSIPSAKDREEKQKQLTNQNEYRKWLQEQTGALHRIEWHRVVLDEAHCIKNHLTHEGRMMERCFRHKLNHDLEAGNATSQIRCYLVMLLRLRQAATHPFLLEGMMGDYFSLKDLSTTKERLKALKGGDTVYAQIGSWAQRHTMSNERMREVIEEAERMRQEQLQDARNEDLEAYNSRIDQDEARQDKTQDIAITRNDIIVVGDDSDEVDSQDEVEEDEDGMVPQNYKTPTVDPEVEVDSTAPIIEEDKPRLQPFGRSDFGLDFDMTKELEYLERLKELETASCVQCKSEPPVVPVKGRPLQAFNGDETDEERENDAGMPQDNVNEKEYVLANQRQEAQHACNPSAKMTALKETVLRWQAEAPDDKIIIFSQFNVVMKIIGRILESEGICFAYLSGKQNTDQRNKAVDEFQNGNKVKVLIVSLRAGGQCLNLTRGNRVILIELWWNHAVEQQAFARVFRIGQIKETHFVRFIVNTPIERRMLQMQVSKILAIDEALQDDKARAPKIGLEDIASLLGRVTMRNSVMHVVSDYDDYEDDDDDLFSSDDEDDLEDFVVPDNVVEYAGDEEQDGLVSDDG
ncbi:SNF2 family domain-containing protein [Colletotrichum tofieldiae]|nr:SNF2 family domain-containing protein [Colletotrichum tofieldiae]